MNNAMKMFKAFFAKDLLLKIFSLVFAIILWFIVMNTLNPTEIKTFTASVTFTNESTLTDNELVILNKEEIQNTKVVIKVRGTRPALDELSKAKNKGEIKAVINLEQLEDATIAVAPADYSLAVTPTLPSSFSYSYEIASCTPTRVDAQLDKLTSRVLPLTINTNGQLGDGYKAEEPEVSTSTVTVTGPSSMFGDIETVQADVDINGKTEDISVSTAPAVYDEAGNVMPLFKVEPTVVDITIGINKQWQIPIKEPTTVGELEDGLELKSIDYTPKYAEVEGKTSDINKVGSIELPPIDLTSVVATKSVSYDIRPYLKDADVNLRDGSPSQITVTVTVEATDQKTIFLNSNAFVFKNIAQGLEANAKGTQVTVKGRKTELATLDTSSVKAEVDLSGLGEGEHTCEIKLELPEGIEIEGEAKTSVVIKGTNADSADTPNDTGDSSETEDTPADAAEEDETAQDGSGSAGGSGSDEN
jgi:YbbR domain-containing protein